MGISSCSDEVAHRTPPVRVRDARERERERLPASLEASGSARGPGSFGGRGRRPANITQSIRKTTAVSTRHREAYSLPTDLAIHSNVGQLGHVIIAVVGIGVVVVVVDGVGLPSSSVAAVAESGPALGRQCHMDVCMHVVRTICSGLVNASHQFDGGVTSGYVRSLRLPASPSAGRCAAIDRHRAWPCRGRRRSRSIATCVVIAGRSSSRGHHGIAILPGCHTS